MDEGVVLVPRCDHIQILCAEAGYNIRSSGLDRKIPTFGNSGFVLYLWRRYDLNGRKE